VQIIVEARKNAAVDALYQKVEAQTPITLKAIAGCTWSSATKAGVTEIEVGTALHPEAALYHELLHADLKISGLTLPPFAVSKNPNSIGISDTLYAIENELQHHRMFGAFTAAGFSPAHFYDDDDHAAFKKIRQTLDAIAPSAAPTSFLMLLLTIIAPGGKNSDADRQTLKKTFYSRCSGGTRAKMEKIEGVFKAWTASPSLDTKPPIIQILNILGEYDGTWIGGGTPSPSNGEQTAAIGVSSAVHERHARQNPTKYVDP